MGGISDEIYNFGYYEKTILGEIHNKFWKDTVKSIIKFINSAIKYQNTQKLRDMPL